jgi:hypothetical protein
MDLESTLSTIAATVPQEIEQVVNQVAYYIPGELRAIMGHATKYLPAELSFITVAQFMLYFAAASLILGIMGRVVLGKRSSLNHSLSSVMGILFVYVVTVILYTFKPWNMDLMLSPLPFATFSDHYLIIHPITNLQFSALCSDILSLIILAFLINLVDTFMPQGQNLVSWFLLRLITVLLCFGLHLLVSWAFRTYLPGVLVDYAPMILLVLLAVLVLSGAVTLILGLVISITNPFLGAMYSFFFSNVVGKQLSKALFTSAILCVILYLMDVFGFVVIIISPAALLTYIPLAVAMVVLWYLIGYLL